MPGGRPKKPIEELRDEPLKVYLTTQERAFVDRRGGSPYIAGLIRERMDIVEKELEKYLEKGFSGLEKPDTVVECPQAIK